MEDTDGWRSEDIKVLGLHPRACPLIDFTSELTSTKSRLIHLSQRFPWQLDLSQVRIQTSTSSFVNSDFGA